MRDSLALTRERLALTRHRMAVARNHQAVRVPLVSNETDPAGHGAIPDGNHVAARRIDVGFRGSGAAARGVRPATRGCDAGAGGSRRNTTGKIGENVTELATSHV